MVSVTNYDNNKVDWSVQSLQRCGETSGNISLNPGQFYGFIDIYG